MRRLLSSESGFTLIETLVVLVLIALALGLVGPYVFQKLGQGRRDATKSQISGIEMALSQYRLDNGTYPTTEQGLSALRKKPATPPVSENWNGPYLEKSVPVDPWGHEYLYVCPGKNNKNSFDLFSLGGDGAEGGEGEAADIVNWSNE